MALKSDNVEWSAERKEKKKNKNNNKKRSKNNKSPKLCLGDLTGKNCFRYLKLMSPLNENTI